MAVRVIAVNAAMVISVLMVVVLYKRFFKPCAADHEATFGAGLSNTTPMEITSELLDAGLWGLFLASFLAATVLPFSSEAILAAMALGPWSTLSLWAVASAGNWAGGMSSYGLGRLGDLERIARWLRTDPQKAQRLQQWVDRRGYWAALLTWVPVIGDPLAIALGLGKAPWLPVTVLMFIGKAARYAVVLALLR